jgi:hypothetical protein
MTELSGFATIVIGTFLLHTTPDMEFSLQDLSRLTKDSSAVVTIPQSMRDRKALEEVTQPLNSAANVEENQGRMYVGKRGPAV